MPTLLFTRGCSVQFPNFWFKEKINRTETDLGRARSMRPGMGAALFHGPLGQDLDRGPRKPESLGWKRSRQGTPEHGVGAPMGSSWGQCNPI